MKHSTSKEFLTKNRNLVFKSINTKFYNEAFNMNELAKDYFEFIQNSKYNEFFQLNILKKDLWAIIGYSVDDFKKQYKILKYDYKKINDFKQELKNDAFTSKSL